MNTGLLYIVQIKTGDYAKVRMLNIKNSVILSPMGFQNVDSQTQ